MNDSTVSAIICPSSCPLALSYSLWRRTITPSLLSHLLSRSPRLFKCVLCDTLNRHVSVYLDDIPKKDHVHHVQADLQNPVFIKFLLHPSSVTISRCVVGQGVKHSRPTTSLLRPRPNLKAGGGDPKNTATKTARAALSSWSND